MKEQLFQQPWCPRQWPLAVAWWHTDVWYLPGVPQPQGDSQQEATAHKQIQLRVGKSYSTQSLCSYSMRNQKITPTKNAAALD